MAKPRASSQKLSSGSRPVAKPQAEGDGKSVWLGLLVAVATVFAYLPALNGRFLWNDLDYVTRPELRSLGGLGRIWFEVGATEQYYPLLHSGFWLQHIFFGDNPLGYHVVNLFMHLGATLLLAALLRKLLTGEPGTAGWVGGDPTVASWLGAAFFSLHPVHVSSVAWISEQKNTLSLLLYLAAALVYLRFDRTRERRYYLGATALFALFPTRTPLQARLSWRSVRPMGQSSASRPGMPRRCRLRCNGRQDQPRKVQAARSRRQCTHQALSGNLKRRQSLL